MGLVLQSVGRPCTICGHADRHEIDTAIVVGKPYGSISAVFGVTEQSVRRHAQAHLPKAAVNEAHEKQRAAHEERAEDLIQRARSLQGRALAIARRAEASGQLGTAIQGLREVGRFLELQGRLMGQLRPADTTVNIMVNEQFVYVQQTILNALTPYPEARNAVLVALEQLD
jgi:hypothetical protein